MRGDGGLEVFGNGHGGEETRHLERAANAPAHDLAAAAAGDVLPVEQHAAIIGRDGAGDADILAAAGPAGLSGGGLNWPIQGVADEPATSGGSGHGGAGSVRDKSAPVALADRAVHGVEVPEPGGLALFSVGLVPLLRQRSKHRR